MTCGEPQRGLYQYLDDGPKSGNTFGYVVNVTASNSRSSTLATPTVTVNNVVPRVAKIGNPHQIDEGTSISRTVSFTDPGTQDHWTYTVNWGDGTVQGPTATAVKSFALSHTYADNGTYSAIVTVYDDDSGAGSSSFQVKVLNVDPLLNPISNIVVNAGSAFSVTGNFTDPGHNTEIFSYTINWGDSSNSIGSGIIDVPGSAGVLTAGHFTTGHSYATAGTYTVTANVTDDDGGSDSVTFEVTVTNLSTSQSSAAGAVVASTGKTAILKKKR